MASVRVYDIGDAPRLYVQYADASSGAPVDPTSIVLKVRNVTANITYGDVTMGMLTNSTPGLWEYNFQIPRVATSGGTYGGENAIWAYRFEADFTGPPPREDSEHTFEVRGSAFY